MSNLSSAYSFRAVCIIFAFLALSFQSASADYLILNTGGRVEGEVIEETETQVRFSIEGMGEVTFSREDVSSIVRRERAPSPTEIPMIEEDLAPVDEMAVEVAEPSPTLRRIPTPVFTPTMPPPPEPESSPTPISADDLRQVLEELFPSEDIINEESGEWYPPEPSGLEKFLDLFMDRSPYSNVFWLIYQILMIFLCIKIGEKKGHSILFSVLCGLFFGIFGLIIVSLQPSHAKIAFIACCLVLLLFMCLLFGLLFMGVLALEDFELDDEFSFEEYESQTSLQLQRTNNMDSAHNPEYHTERHEIVNISPSIL